METLRAHDEVPAAPVGLTKTDSKLGMAALAGEEGDGAKLRQRRRPETPANAPEEPTVEVPFDYAACAQEPGEFEECEEAPYMVLIWTYLGYLGLIILGHIKDAFGKLFKPQEYRHLRYTNGFAPLSSDFEAFYTRRLYRRIRDCWNRPITGVAGRSVTLLDRVSTDGNKTFQLTGSRTPCLNLSSYNYLGFAQAEGPCADAVEAAIAARGVGTCGSQMAGSRQGLHEETEELVARFVGSEAALVVSMGYATNSTTIPALADAGCLLLSDELNHASLVSGSRLSGATIRVFKHNNMNDLEQVLRTAISQGQPRTHRPWKKILVVVEGLYSMEGTFCNLPGLLALKRKYKFYLYLDEAHSIGALGPRGRGVCDYFGVDPREVDVLMGTFTKSFGSAGGYIAGSRAMIDHLRLHCHGTVYAEAMAPPVTQQIYSSMRIIAGEDGSGEGARRIAALARNARYVSSELRKMGFIIYGHPHSPVIPLLLFMPWRLPDFSREMLRRGIAVVVVGYPATPIISGRVRFCISASHTVDDLQRALRAISEVGDQMYLKVSSRRAVAV